MQGSRRVISDLAPSFDADREKASPLTTRIDEFSFLTNCPSIPDNIRIALTLRGSYLSISDKNRPASTLNKLPLDMIRIDQPRHLTDCNSIHVLFVFEPSLAPIFLLLRKLWPINDLRIPQANPRFLRSLLFIL
jgi:hypothetical protein